MNEKSIEKFGSSIEECLQDDNVKQDLGFLIDKYGEDEVVSDLLKMLVLYVEGEKL